MVLGRHFILLFLEYLCYTAQNSGIVAIPE